MAAPRPPVPRVDAVLATLRRGQRQLARDPRGAIEVAVKQLLAGRPRSGPPRRDAPPVTYRIDDLARVTGVTVRNIRAYVERGLLHPATRAGRVALFDDTHVTRLKIITSMLERGYTSAHIVEMLTAWERGQDLSDVLGLENALVTPRVDDPPTTLSVTDARALAGGAEDLQLVIDAGLAERSGARVRVLRPKLLEAFAEMRTYGLATTRLIAIHQDVVPSADRIGEVLVRAGAENLGSRLLGDQAPTPEDVEQLVATLTRFRELAMTTVTATIAASVESTIEQLLSDYLSHYVSRHKPADAG